jgi:hypothetical protein
MPLMTRPARIESPSNRPRRPAYQAASPAQKLSERASSKMMTRIVSVSATFTSWRTSKTASGGTASRRKEPQLEARRDEPLLHRRRSSELQLDETAREDVRRADRDNRTVDDRDDVERLQGSPAVVDDQHTDQRDCRGDDTADDRGPRRQVERVVPHSGEPTSSSAAAPTRRSLGSSMWRSPDFLAQFWRTLRAKLAQ